MAQIVTPKSPLDRFQMTSTLATPRIIAASVGGPGSGKTQFWMTAPEPIVFMSMDWGMEGVVDKFQENFFEEHGRLKEIRVIDYDWSPTAEDEARGEDFKAEAIAMRNRFIADYLVACEHAKTVVWDKETDVWNLFRYAEFGSPKGDKARDFDKANQLMRKYVNHTKKLKTNMGFIEDVKDKWVSQNAKDGVQRAGFREIEGLVHVDLWHERRNGEFFTLVGKARGKGAAEVQDKEFKNLTIPMLGMMLFPETEDSDWE